MEHRFCVLQLAGVYTTACLCARLVPRAVYEVNKGDLLDAARTVPILMSAVAAERQ